jgi:hypothetical protein
MVGHEINDGRLYPMRQIAPVHLEFGFGIEERRHIYNIYNLCIYLNPNSRVVWIGWVTNVAEPKVS